ncbi:MAG: hypothetical protein IE924_05000 [Microbacterium sp.]|uniref:glycosyltransferase 87 family protein n=1 Tax=Microbacterium sp. TaxID=51671 RepID=UPI0019A58B40|nr:glycosyltransferase 87 family protein [Microbacterium sp.]MBD3757443.1 hypothetical protein [Microbacterium sp.]
MLTGGLVYAVWPAVVVTEQTIMLEPVLALALLLALLCLRRRSPSVSLAAGLILGVAATVKVWAVIDIAILIAVVAATAGARAVRWFCAGAATAVVIVCAPFFFRAPTSMWDMVVTTQLSRPSGRVSTSDRLSISSPLLHVVDVPVSVLAALCLTLIVLAIAPLVISLRHRRPPSMWSEAVWWGIVVLVHAAVLATSAVFFYHYVAWVAAPICLLLGVVASRIHPTWRWVAVVPATGLALAHVIATPTAIVPSSYPHQRLSDWAATRSCVFGWGSDLVAANAVSRNFRNGCAQEVDPGGVFLVMHARGVAQEDVSIESPAWLAHEWRLAQGADGAIISNWRADWLLRSERPPYRDLFVELWNDHGITVWNRR